MGLIALVDGFDLFKMQNLFAPSDFPDELVLGFVP